CLGDAQAVVELGAAGLRLGDIDARFQRKVEAGERLFVAFEPGQHVALADQRLRQTRFDRQGPLVGGERVLRRQAKLPQYPAAAVQGLDEGWLDRQRAVIAVERLLVTAHRGKRFGVVEE